MATTLRQRHWLSSITFTLEYNGVRIEDRGFNKQISSFVPFEEVPPNPFFLRVFQKWAIILAMFCGVWLLVFLLGIGSPSFNPINYPIMLGLILVPAAALWFSRIEIAGFGSGGGGLLVVAHKPSRAAVQEFLTALQAARTSYLREVYLERAVPMTPEEELRRLIWLKDQGIITLDELEDRRRKLFPTQQPSGGMGFQTR